MKIHGIAYLIIGAILSFVSKYIDTKRNSASLTLFFYIGLAFITIGIFKLLVSFILREKIPKPEKQTIQTVLANKPQQPAQIKTCPYCHSTVNPANNFCYNCGARLR